MITFTIEEAEQVLEMLYHPDEDTIEALIDEIENRIHWYHKHVATVDKTLEQIL